MTGQEALDRMRELGGGDVEADHLAADDVLCQLLRSLGFNALIDVYESIGKWYA